MKPDLELTPSEKMRILFMLAEYYGDSVTGGMIRASLRKEAEAVGLIGEDLK